MVTRGKRRIWAGVAAGAMLLIAFAVGIFSRFLWPQLGGHSDISREVMDFLLLADEAKAEAQSILPQARLYLISYTPQTGGYAFQFTEPDSSRHVIVLGPKEPSVSGWEVSESKALQGLPVQSFIDLGDLQKTPALVAVAAARETGRAPSTIGVLLESDAGKLKWLVDSLGREGIDTRCDLWDSEELERLSCNQ